MLRIDETIARIDADLETTAGMVRLRGYEIATLQAQQHADRERAFNLQRNRREIVAAKAALALSVPVVADVTGEHSSLCMSDPAMTSPDQRGDYVKGIW